MTCPNCGKEYTDDLHVCPVCNTLLSNAIYTPIPYTGKKKKSFILPIAILLIAGLAAIGIRYYESYMAQVEKDCRKMASVTFENRADLSPELKESFRETLLPTLLANVPNQNELPDCFDADKLYETMQDNANLEITGVSASFPTCTVHVKVSNLDYESFLHSLNQAISEDLDTNQSTWEVFKENVKTFWFGEDQHKEYIANSFKDSLDQHYLECLNQTPAKEYTSDITYTFRNGKWVLKDFDENLVAHYYGLE